MTLQDLSHDEKLALAGLMEVTFLASGTLSEAENADVDELVNELGEEDFRHILDEAEARFADREALKDFLRTIRNQEARELIYGTVLTDSLAEIMPHAEFEILDWLAGEWKIPVSVDESDTAGR